MRGEPAASEQEAIELLTDLVRTPSVSPEIPGGTGEAAMAAKVAAYAESCGAEVVYQEALPGRPNVVGTLEGSRFAEEWVMLGSHYDAWGFGAIDPNGGTPMISAAISISRIAIQERPTLPRVRFLAIRANTTTITRQNR